MISFNIVWHESEYEDWALVGFYRLSLRENLSTGITTWYLDHLFPYAGGEGLEPVATGYDFNRKTARQLIEHALTLELNRIERKR